MAVYKRGKLGNYWYEFVWQGERIRESTGQTNPRMARQMLRCLLLQTGMRVGAALAVRGESVPRSAGVEE